MSTMIRRDRIKVKPARKTVRPDAPFGVGLLVSAPYYGNQPFTQDDLDWAAQAFARDDEGTPFDLLAAEASGFDAVTAGCYA